MENVLLVLKEIIEYEFNFFLYLIKDIFRERFSIIISESFFIFYFLKSLEIKKYELGESFVK